MFYNGNGKNFGKYIVRGIVMVVLTIVGSGISLVLNVFDCFVCFIAILDILKLIYKGKHTTFLKIILNNSNTVLIDVNCLSKGKPKKRSVPNFQISTIEVKPTKPWPITTCAHSSS